MLENALDCLLLPDLKKRLELTGMGGHMLTRLRAACGLDCQRPGSADGPPINVCTWLALSVDLQLGTASFRSRRHALCKIYPAFSNRHSSHYYHPHVFTCSVHVKHMTCCLLSIHTIRIVGEPAEISTIRSVGEPAKISKFDYLVV